MEFHVGLDTSPDWVPEGLGVLSTSCITDRRWSAMRNVVIRSAACSRSRPMPLGNVEAANSVMVHCGHHQSDTFHVTHAYRTRDKTSGRGDQRKSRQSRRSPDTINLWRNASRRTAAATPDSIQVGGSSRPRAARSLDATAPRHRSNRERLGDRRPPARARLWAAWSGSSSKDKGTGRRRYSAHATHWLPERT